MTWQSSQPQALGRGDSHYKDTSVHSWAHSDLRSRSWRKRCTLMSRWALSGVWAYLWETFARLYVAQHAHGRMLEQALLGTQAR